MLYAVSSTSHLLVSIAKYNLLVICCFCHVFPSLLLLLAGTNERPSEGILDRHIEWVEECKAAVQALRSTTKQAKAHREECCSVLGAALAAALALEQAVYSCALSTAKAQELQRLYAAVTAAIELAQQRVQVSKAGLHLTLQLQPQSHCLSYAMLFTFQLLFLLLQGSES